MKYRILFAFFIISRINPLFAQSHHFAEDKYFYVNGELKKVEEGQTIYSIAKKYAVPPEEIYIWGDKDEHATPYKATKEYILHTNDVIFIPELILYIEDLSLNNLRTCKISQHIYNLYNDGEDNREHFYLPMNCYNYSVEQGESVFSVAKKFKVHPSLLYYLNNRLEEYENKEFYKWRLTVGDSIIIPKDRFRYQVYPDDNLFKISQFFSISVEEIIKINELKSDKIEEGEFLLIPKSATIKFF